MMILLRGSVLPAIYANTPPAAAPDLSQKDRFKGFRQKSLSFLMGDT